MVTRGCAWLHVGHSVCKLAGLQAQNPNRVVCKGKQPVLAYIPKYLFVSLHFFVMLFVCYKDSIPSEIM